MKPLFFLHLFVFIWGQSFAQLECLEEIHGTEIHSLDSYSEHHELHFRNLNWNQSIVSIPCNELGSIEDLSVEILKNGSWRKTKLHKELSISTLDWSSFYSGVQYYQLPVPALSQVKVSYKTSNKHSIFVSGFPKKGYFNGNQVAYSLKIPDGFAYSFREGQRISDTLFHKISFTDSLDQFGVIHSIDQEAEDFFVDWFQSRINPQLELTKESANDVKSSLQEINKSKEELAAACFYYVQSKIKYVDIENGIHAIIPRNCNVTLSNGYGDCKDMATLLAAILRSQGFDAYLAVSRTSSREDTLNFPSISLGNHMICALHLDDRWIYLDATEDGCEFGDPSFQILGTEILILDSDIENRFLTINRAPSLMSKLELSYVFDLDSRIISLKGATTGKINLMTSMIKQKRKNPEALLLKILNHNGGWRIDSLSLNRSESYFILSKDIPDSRISEIGKTLFLEPSDIMDIETILECFQFEEYPYFPFDLTISIDFGRKIDESEFESVQLFKVIQDKKILLSKNVEIRNSSEDFQASQLYKDWQTLLKQPIILNQ